ncbi:MAG: YIP1 family protein [Oscillospiraceae bacterium]|nr:YIP1 family protein [Oscillospiraceae bacterium]
MKKRVLRILMVLLLLLNLCLGSAVSVSAENATAYTYVMLSNGEWMRTQDAYIPDSVTLHSQNLLQPEDLCITQSHIYIADTGNRRIVMIDRKSGEAVSFGEDHLQAPSGVCIRENGSIYVADRGLCSILVFNKDGELQRSYDRPTEATFGSQTQYIPTKVAVDPEGLMYVVSSGSYDGIVQMSAEGTFLGYFGYNNNPTTLGDWLIDRFFTDAQKQQLLNKIPFSFRNLVMDQDHLLYTVTMTAEGNALKKHDVAGNNLFPTDMYDETNFVDLCIGPDRQVYAVTETGLIYEYDPDGGLLFSLGGLTASRELVGLFTKVSAMECDENGNLYILDQERGLMHIFTPTAFSDTVHSALNAYNEGRYEHSRDIWQSVRQISGSCQMVENGLGNCAFQQHDYDTAALFYRLAENTEGYSDAYWQIRNDQLSQILPWIFAGLVLVLLAYFVYDKWIYELIPYRKPSRYTQNLKMVFGAIRHPVDTFESIRWADRGDYLTATLLYIALYIVFVCNYVLRGFVVSTANTENTSLLFVTLIFLIPVALFLGCNFLVGEINDSKARFRDLYIGLSYCGAPFLVIMPFVILLSHAVTLNESRILSLVSVAVYVWCFILLIIFLKEVHRYLLRTVFANLGITVFLMAVVILAASLLGMFADQMLGFFIEVIKEVQLRVQ